MNRQCDVVVVGSGFAGSLFAMIARRQGRSVILVERGRHPRFAIGESSTPLSNLLLEDIAQRYDLPAVRPLAKWGSWKKHYPHIGCGLKRGFTFFHHDPTSSGADLQNADNTFLVAASPHDEIADTHWYRSDLDAFLAREAQRLGVNYVDDLTLHSCADNGSHMELQGKRRGEEVTIQSAFVVDATGPRGCLHRLLRLSETNFPRFPRTVALYNHFTGVQRRSVSEYEGGNCRPPYSLEDAAVHYIFDGGWIWLLHFNNGLTSAGVAATQNTAERFRLHEGEQGWARIVEEVPALADHFSGAQPTLPFTFQSHLSFRSTAIAGARWALLPSAAGFVDPLLSTGFPLTLLGIHRLAAALELHWQKPGLKDTLTSYAAKTGDELDITAQLIAALYANMGNFSVFRAISLLYFAAASFSEAAWRLGKPENSHGFLLHDNVRYARILRCTLDRAVTTVPIEQSTDFVSQVQKAIEPFDVAGLSKSRSPSWFPVDGRDLLDSGWKLGATDAEISQMLHRSGFFECNSVSGASYLANASD